MARDLWELSMLSLGLVLYRGGSVNTQDGQNFQDMLLIFLGKEGDLLHAAGNEKSQRGCPSSLGPGHPLWADPHVPTQFHTGRFWSRTLSGNTEAFIQVIELPMARPSSPASFDHGGLSSLRAGGFDRCPWSRPATRPRRRPCHRATHFTLRSSVLRERSFSRLVTHCSFIHRRTERFSTLVQSLPRLFIISMVIICLDIKARAVPSRANG